MSDSENSLQTDNPSDYSDQDEVLPLHMMTAESIAKLDPFR